MVKYLEGLRSSDKYDYSKGNLKNFYLKNLLQKA